MIKLNKVFNIIKRYEKMLWIIIFILLSCNAIMMLFFHEPWRDEAQAWLLIRDNNILGLLSQVKYDGHPLTWYLLMLPLVRLKLPFVSMYVLHCLIVIICIYLLCFCVKGNPLIRLTLLLGSALPSELTINARNYAVSILLILLLMIWYDRRFSTRKIQCSICLFLLANTYIYAAIIPIALFCAEVFLILYEKLIERRPSYTRSECFGFIWFFGGIVTGVTLLLLTFATDVFAPFNRFMNVSGPPIHYIKEIGPTEAVMQFFSLLSESTLGIETPYIYLRIAFYVLFLSIILLSSDLKRILYTAVLLISWIIGFCMLLIIARALAFLRHAAIMPFFLAMIWFITPKVKPPKIMPVLTYLLLCSIICGGKVNIEKVWHEMKIIDYSGQQSASFLLKNGYDSDDVLIIGDDVVSNSVITAYLRNVPALRYCCNSEEVDMTYTVWQYPEKKGYKPNYDDAVDFAIKQASLYKDQYRAILFLYNTLPNQSLPCKLLYCEPSNERQGKFYRDEYVDIYLLAENGQLLTGDNT